MEFNSKPKKYKKYHRIVYKGLIRYTKLLSGNFGLRILRHLKLHSLTLTFLIKMLKKNLKGYNKKIKIRLRVFPDFGVTNKPKDIRMGRGKGLVTFKVCNVRSGTIFLELLHIYDKRIAMQALKLCINKISVPCRIIYTNNYD
jgi:ribosomal protein L16